MNTFSILMTCFLVSMLAAGQVQALQDKLPFQRVNRLLELKIEDTGGKSLQEDSMFPSRDRPAQQEKDRHEETEVPPTYSFPGCLCYLQTRVS